MTLSGKTLPAKIYASVTDTSSIAVVLPPSATGRSEIQSVSYSELRALVSALSRQLNGLAELNERQVSISISLPNSLEFLIAFLAIGQNALIAAPLNPAYTRDEAEFYLSDSSAKLLLVPKGALSSPPSGAVQAAQNLGILIGEVIYLTNQRAIVLEIAGRQVLLGPTLHDIRPQESDTMLLLHTSGTTGKPKAVPLSHRNLITTMYNIKNTYNLTASDRSFIVMPLFHVHGLLAALLAPLGSGGSCVIPPQFAARSFWNEFQLSHSNWYTAVPTIHQILLHSPIPSPLPKIRFIRSCSSALSQTTHQELELTFRAPVLEAYAMTEATHQMTSNPLPPAKRKPGTVGLPQGVDLRILSFDSEDEVEEGEVCIRGPNVTAGYLNNQKANTESFTTQGRFFRTGDRGKLDADGYLTLTGRLKELINRGGEKLSPLELDGALLTVPGVAEAVAFGVPNSKYGEVPWAAVVLKNGTQITQNDIQKDLSKRLGQFKIPEKIFIVDKIPKTATGKVQRRKVAEVFLVQNQHKPRL
ncbi:hypothetical protein CROQUDRAFT_77681 [Cronartium quercuum f. sp. fusiforme G11]|uniref:Peroxisomal-coenzyme A synthetase n=1 Tax=Cronartium quercuum f. sp. fusiforme G11 TaxID=708437 RepID=A0A9P6TDA6_9BASI|nr:hypothetical protein CROQUDRAFT_77681 [Cronartium quercuum f. sp. fusiforme G11]